MNLAELANATDGFSGADLQALVYNAHLEVVHDTIAHHPSADSSSKSKPNGTVDGDTEPIRYTALGSESQGRVLSRAEESAFQRRVRPKPSSTAPDHGIRECDLLTSAWTHIQLQRIMAETSVDGRGRSSPSPPSAKSVPDGGKGKGKQKPVSWILLWPASCGNLGFASRHSFLHLHCALSDGLRGVMLTVDLFVPFSFRPLSVQKHEITEEHLERVLKATRPSVPREERERLRRM